MPVTLVGLNHKSAPLTVREKVAFTESSLADYLTRLREKGAAGAVILSTCNRTEIYLSHSPAFDGREIAVYLLAAKSGYQPEEVEPYLYIKQEREAVRHLLRVAAGLDSMVLGETQILGQVRQAYQLAHSLGATDKVLNILFHQAVTTGKKVRTLTGIDQHPVSISYVAVELARQVFGNLTGRSVLLIGAGKMSELTARYLVENGVASVIVSNRSFPRAQQLAQKFGGRAVRFDQLIQCMVEADIVISCTSASHFVVHYSDVAEVIQHRNGRPLMMVDIAVPRDIDPRVGELQGVILFDVDSLQDVVDQNLAARQRAAARGEELIDQAVREFFAWLNVQSVVPVISALKRKGEEIKQKELKRALNRLGELSEHDRKVIGTLANSVVNQLLHEPITRLKSLAGSEEAQAYAEALRLLFSLDEYLSEVPAEKREGEEQEHVCRRQPACRS